MNGPLLLLDTPYLCHRAYHAMGDVAPDDKGLGAVYGVLRDIVFLQDWFQTDRCVFAFDMGRSRRAKILPTYKATRTARRAEDTEEEKQARRSFYRHIQRLHREYLPGVGFRNVFAARGFEADDVIAAIARDLPRHVEAVIVGSDQDLWQCLRPNVWCWNPGKRKAYTLEHFRKEWGLAPDQWADVKAYAGCSSDDIPGVPGVGEKTAAKYIRGELKKGTKAYAKLAAAELLCARNIHLTRLPYVNTPTFELRPDAVTEDAWRLLAKSLNMPTLAKTPPRAAVRKPRGRKRRGFGLGTERDRK